jgi:6-phosphogluconolactonase
VSETASTLTALSLDASSGTLTAIETASTLTGSTIDAGATTGAEVWVHPTGNWVLASNRGDDSLAVFAVDPSSGKMTFHGRTKSGGATPRSFAIGPSGAFVAAANEGGNNVVPFAFDSATGALSPGSGNDLGVASPSFVGFARLPAP